MTYREFRALALRGLDPVDAVDQHRICTLAQLSSFVSLQCVKAGTHRYHERLFAELYAYV